MALKVMSTFFAPCVLLSMPVYSQDLPDWSFVSQRLVPLAALWFSAIEWLLHENDALPMKR